MKRALLLLAVLAAAVMLEHFLRDRDSTTHEERSASVSKEIRTETPAPARQAPEVVRPRPQAPRKPLVMMDVVENAERLANPDAKVEDDLQIVGELLRVYFRYMGETPEGGLNEEIVACLRGENPKNITFLGPDNAKLNQVGELVDRFGTPYYFHPLSAEQIEVRSAGPDKKLWSNDDVLLE